MKTLKAFYCKKCNTKLTLFEETFYCCPYCGNNISNTYQSYYCGFCNKTITKPHIEVLKKYVCSTCGIQGVAVAKDYYFKATDMYFPEHVQCPACEEYTLFDWLKESIFTTVRCIVCGFEFIPFTKEIVTELAREKELQIDFIEPMRVQVTEKMRKDAIKKSFL